MHLFLSHPELHDLISAYGYWLVGGVIAFECLGLPLPGEAALIAAAVIAGDGTNLNVFLVIAASIAGASLGSVAAFWIGREFGFRLLLRFSDAVGLTERKIKLGQYLFLRHGGKVLFFGRFVALLRAFAPLLAGINRMKWRDFLVANTVGVTFWAVLYGLAAYIVGKEIRHILGPVGLTLLAAALVLGALSFRFVKRHESELEDAAERALPGPLRARRVT